MSPASPRLTMSRRGSPRQIIGAIGAIVVLGSGFLAWQDAAPANVKATDVSVEFLVNHKAADGTPSIFLTLAVGAALIGVGLLIGRRLAVFAGGALGALSAVLFAVQLQRFIDDVGANDDVLDVLGIGVFIALVGGALAIVASFIPDTDEDAQEDADEHADEQSLPGVRPSEAT